MEEIKVIAENYDLAREAANSIYAVSADDEKKRADEAEKQLEEAHREIERLKAASN